MIVSKYLLFIAIIFFNCTNAQTSLEKKTHIEGEILYDRLEDTIVFSNDFIPAKFYDISHLEACVSHKKFNLDLNVQYPQLYTLRFTSERGKISAWGGDYFIDSTTTYIVIDSIVGCSNVIGKTYLEYKNIFLPFMLDNNYDCKLSIIELLRNKDENFDQKLLQYTIDNPNSYVALWALIKIVNSEGYSLIYETILNSFSDQMKKNVLWKILKEDLNSIRIKLNEKFPVLDLKSQELVDVKLKLPKTKFILIDYWFNNCRPCLEKFPKIKEIYNKYQTKGFEVIGISVDRTKNIPKWQERIGELNLTWINYLDENGMESIKDKIYSFPTTFLLNEKGQIIKKNIELDELEDILRENL